MADHIPLEEWKAQKQAQRDALAQKQLVAMANFCDSGKALSVYLCGRGRLGSRLSSGNAALILQQIPQARAVDTLQEWNKKGRYVNRGAHGITVLSRKHNGNGYYLTTDTVFDVSQTNGSPFYPPRNIQTTPQQQRIAIQSIVELAPVPIEVGDPLLRAASYQSGKLRIVVRKDATNLQLLQDLPAALVEASLALDAPDTSPDEVRFLSSAVSLEICGRFSLPVPAKNVTMLEPCKYILTPDKVREHFDNAREFARTIGDQIEQHLSRLPSRTRDVRSQNERG